MSVELPRPGVEVIQKFQSASPTILRPTLVPFITGAAKEIVDVLTSDGTINPDAKQGSYDQLPKVIAKNSFPSPRGNILEVVPDLSSIRCFFSFGGSLTELSRDPGESFLTAANDSRSAIIQFKPVGAGGYDVENKTLVFAVDQPARLSTAKDVVVTFPDTGGNKLNATQLKTAINTAAGSDVAAIDGSGNTARVYLVSPTYGALSSLTVRAGGSANTALGFADVTKEYRVLGAGFQAQDQNNNTTVSPWIEWNRGGYMVDGGAVTSFPALGNNANFGLRNQSGTPAASQAPALVFSGNGSIQLKVGDRFFADGVELNSGAVVMKVEAARFKLGVLNTSLSVFDEKGHIVSAVYNPSNVNTLLASSPLSPRYAWFRAANLTGNPAALAATLTGTASGASATSAAIQGSAQGGPFNLTGLTLVLGITVDGVEQDNVTFTFSGGQLASMSDVATALTAANLDGFVFAENANKLIISTEKTGAKQSIALRQSSTAGSALGFTFGGSDLTADGTDVEFKNIPPVLTGATQTFPFTPGNGETLVIQTSSDGGVTWGGDRTFTFPNNNPIADIAALVAALKTANSWDGAALPATFAFTNAGNAVVITGASGGALKGLKVKANSTGIDGAGNFDTKLGFTSGQTDQGEDELTGHKLRFKLNNRPKTYEVIFTSNSLVDAVDAINAAVEMPVASAGGTNDEQLVLTSTLKGMASSLEVVDDLVTQKTNVSFGFGVSNRSAVGSGRPNPDFTLDVNGNLVLGAEMLRSVVTGQPYDPGVSDIYVQYEGLRLDVSPSAKKPGILQLSDTATLKTVLGPINAKNPLGLGMFFAMINAPGLIVTGLGVDDAPASAPEGSLAGFTSVAGFIESQEVWCIAPLTHDETVHQMFNAHAQFMSDSGQKGERIVLANPKVPSRAVDAVLGSGLSGNTTATSNQFLVDVNPASALLAKGINPAQPIPLSANLFLEVTVDGAVRNYNVSAANGVVLTLKTSFASGENVDGFFTTAALTESLVNATWALKIRGSLLTIPGSSLPDKNAIAQTTAAKASAYAQRRFYYLFPDQVKAILDGTEQILDGYYACAALAGMCSSFAPQQGFTNMPMAGFSGVVGSNDFFSSKQLDQMAGGGVYILVQDAPGAPITARHQLSTDLSSIETRELSITKVVDYVAKFLRTGLRRFIGTFNITQPFLDTLSTVIHGMLKFLEDRGVIISGDLSNLIQSKDQPDTVLVDVVLNVPYPCNYIRLTLII